VRGGARSRRGTGGRRWGGGGGLGCVIVCIYVCLERCWGSLAVCEEGGRAFLNPLKPHLILRKPRPHTPIITPNHKPKRTQPIRQAILPLRGKILNVERKDDAALYKNAELAALIVALGLGAKGGSGGKGGGSAGQSVDEEGGVGGNGADVLKGLRWVIGVFGVGRLWALGLVVGGCGRGRSCEEGHGRG